jgi:hypothetical protein
LFQQLAVEACIILSYGRRMNYDGKGRISGLSSSMGLLTLSSIECSS